MSRYPLLATILSVGVLVTAWGCATRPSEAEVRERIVGELTAAGFDWVQVRVSGREVRLAGTPPGIGDGGDAVRLVSSVSCSTPAGQAPCAASVRADFGTSFVGAEAWPRLELEKEHGVLTLRGTVPDAGTRSAALDAARSAMGTGFLERIVDGMIVEDRTPNMGSEALVARLTRALILCRSGVATVHDRTVSVRCHVPRRRAPAVRELLATPLPAGDLAELDLVVAEDD